MRCPSGFNLRAAARASTLDECMAAAVAMTRDQLPCGCELYNKYSMYVLGGEREATDGIQTERCVYAAPLCEGRRSDRRPGLWSSVLLPDGRGLERVSPFRTSFFVSVLVFLTCPKWR